MYHVRDVSFIGFSEVIKHIPTFRRIFNHLVQECKNRSADMVVLIDYPGFNLRFGSKAKKMGIPVFYYIAPQVWAWHQSRAKKMAVFVNKMAVIFDFEVPFFSKYGIDAEFVGHPLLDGLQVDMKKSEFAETYELNPEQPLLGLFPGSRRQEIEHLLPVMLETADRLKEYNPRLQVAVSQAETIDRDLLRRIRNYPYIKTVVGHTYSLMNAADAAVVASGTATLETACFKTPFILAYQVSPLSYRIGLRLVKIPFIGLVNIVANEEVAREFIQIDLDPDDMAAQLKGLLYDEMVRSETIEKLTGVRERLGEPGAAARTAELVLEML
ncbi:MAG: lipid-A-disaccharide synthase [candidate division KSB1 bacterium]|nr:lipid-A-disaccharide synthase [candidate division KSB1 bacterium]